jgi:hypothetical protein
VRRPGFDEVVGLREGDLGGGVDEARDEGGFPEALGHGAADGVPEDEGEPEEGGEAVAPAVGGVGVDIGGELADEEGGGGPAGEREGDGDEAPGG